MSRVNKNFILNYCKIIIALYLIFSLSNNLYSVENQYSDSSLIRYEQLIDTLLIQNQDLNDDLQQSARELTMVDERMTEMIYFTRLLEFASGLLVIFLTALSVLLLVYGRKNRSLNRLIQLQGQSGKIIPDRPSGSLKENTPAITGRNFPDAADKIKNLEKENATLEKELEGLKQRMIQEQQVRKKMEAEVAELLARIKKS